jgi:hypothetical protein
MKIQTLGMLLLTAASAFAQQEVEVRYSYPEWEVYQNKPPGENHTVSIYSKKGKRKQLEKSFSFNNKDQVERETWYKRSGSVSKETLFSYNDSNKITSRKVILNYKLRNVYEYRYTNFTQISSAQTFFKDTVNPIGSTVYEYTSANKMKSITSYNKDKKVYSRYEYTYNEQGNRTETKYYKKEKLKHSWVYDCDAKGELIEPKTVKICKNRIYETDGSFMEIFENTSKGKVTKTIVKSAPDGRVLENESYDAKGVLKSKSVYQYNEAKKLVKHSKFKGNSNQAQYVELYEYADDSSLTASIHLSKKGAVTSRREFSYN